MCEFRCEICSTARSGGFITVRYESWVKHLLSDGHQMEAKKRLVVREKWPNDEDSFVLTGIVKTNGLPWTSFELAEWLCSFGVLTQFLHNENYYFCVFTLQGIGEMGRERTGSIVTQKEFKGHTLLIRPKGNYGVAEWDLVYDTIDNFRGGPPIESTPTTEKPVEKAVTRPPQQGKNDKVPKIATTSTFNVPKGTKVFTNKNLSSSNSHQQQSAKGANGNNNYLKNEPSKESINNSTILLLEQRSSSTGVAAAATESEEKNNFNEVQPAGQGPSGGVKKRRKSKDKRKQKEHLLETDSTSFKNSRETTPRASIGGSSGGGVMVPPSSLIPQDPKNTIRNASVTPKSAQPQPEPLNFRGGFGRRTHHDEYRVSESSDNNYQPEAATVPFPSSSTSKPLQLPQRTVVNESAAGRGYKNQRQKQKQNGVHQQQQQLQQQSKHFRRGGQSYGRYPPPTGAAGIPPSLPPNSYPHQRPPQQQRQHNFLLSPIFTCQLPPAIAAALSNPLVPTSRNPYKFDNMPEYPYYFDMFQNLPNESFKPQKDILYKNFQKLNLAEQLEQFFIAQTLPFEEVRLRWQVILDILFLLRQQFPRCEIYAFGSILSGLGDFMSDIDIYVDLMGESISTHPIDPSQKMSGQQAVDVVKKLIRKGLCPHTKSRFVQNLIPVKSARVPILKLTHQLTTINCDLSFENRLSVQNTKMLSFYLNLDVRIFRFMVLIRYWGKFHNLTGSNHIKNYALTLLVLVYLTKKGFVPPVELLQRLKAHERKRLRIPQNSDEIDGWDASFCDNLAVIQQNFKAVSLPSPDKTGSSNYISQSQTLVQMTIEFFEMYANVDFSKFVVCPLLGKLLPKEHFHAGSEESLPDTLDRYKNWAMKQTMNRRLNIKTHLCVQDPFVLSFNVGSVTPQGTLLRFQVACAKSLQVLTQEKGLGSFLDVLLHLPAHIGEKKFMRTYKTEVKAQELRTEIRASVLAADAAAEGPTPSLEDENVPSCSSPPPPQVSSYVKLPVHLKSFEKLMDEKGLKQIAKKPRWELFMDFSLASQFEDTFVAEITRYRLQNNKRSNVMDTLCALWQQFTLDFVKEFFETGLKLKVVETKEESVEPYDSTETNGGGTVSGSKPAGAAGEEEGKRKRWKVKMLSKQEEEKLHVQAETLAPKSPQDIAKLSKKISDLPTAPGVIHYKVIKYQVTYPFWEKRPSLYDKMGKEMKASEKVHIPVLPTTKRMKKDKNNKGRRDKQDNKEQLKDGKKGYQISFNPVDLEAKVSDLVAENFKKVKEEHKDFTNFEFDVLVKLDLSSMADRPEVFFIFEKDPTSKCNANTYFRAVQCMGNMLNDAFPCYHIHRLATWLEMPTLEDLAKLNINFISSRSNSSSDKASTAVVGDTNSNKNANNKDTQAKIAGDGTVVGEENAENKDRKKKSGRSQLEEDLLIPSSSSSSSSSTDDEDDGLEDISNNDDDEEEGESNEEQSDHDDDEHKEKKAAAEATTSSQQEQ